VQKLVMIFLSIFILAACAPQATFGDAIIEGEPSPFPTNIVPSRPIYEVQRGDVIDQRSYSGRVSAVRTSQLVFSIDGRVEQTYFSVGDDVTAGDIIAELDTTQLESQLLDAQEELAIAQSLLESAANQITFERQRAELNIELAQTFLDYARLQAANPPSAEESLLIRQRELELELAELALAQVSAGVDPALEYELTRAQEQVDYVNELITQAVLVAPMNGRLISFFVSVGDTVTAFETTGVVADLSELEVTNAIADAEASELTEALPVILQRANSPDEVYEATIYQLPQPFGSANDGLTHIHFNTQPAPLEFELGERISFVVTIAERHDVLWLPVAAIRQFSGRNFVVVQEDGVERRVDIRLGLQGNDRVEILEGLEANQRVIAP
jgi:multidrug efflux pump subunit AcrA (membrane-fusion protein)